MHAAHESSGQIHSKTGVGVRPDWMEIKLLVSTAAQVGRTMRYAGSYPRLIKLICYAGLNTFFFGCSRMLPQLTR